MNLLLAATDASSKLHNLQSQFGIEGKYLLMQVISFSILAFVLYRFFFKPVLATVDERAKTIEAGLKYAEDTKAQLASAQEQSSAIIKQAQADATKLIEEARRTAKEFSERETAAATAHDPVSRAKRRSKWRSGPFSPRTPPGPTSRRPSPT